MDENVRFYFGGCLENYFSLSEMEITTAEYFFIEFINNCVKEADQMLVYDICN